MLDSFRNTLLLISLSILLCSCSSQPPTEPEQSENAQITLRIEQDEEVQSLLIYREGENVPILTQHAKADFRPYLHPIVAPDGKSLATAMGQDGYKNQTGVYWGFAQVNGRDYFQNPDGDYWQRADYKIVDTIGQKVKWQTVYHLLDESQTPILKETQNWTLEEKEGRFLISLEWRGEALTDITIGESNYGGLFLRIPWKEGIAVEVVNAARQKNKKADGQRAWWIDVATQVENRDDLLHIAIFDHPKNGGFPQPWSVDDQFGIGSARPQLGDWQISKGETEVIRNQLVVYPGELNDVELTKLWQSFVGDSSMYSTASLWGIAQEEARAARFLNPQEAVEAMTLKEGYQVNAYASEPMITQPMAFCWDSKGRMWIAENRDYESRSSGFSNSGDSRILILEDTDQDGVADSRKVFLEGIPFPSAIAVGFDGLFLGAPPNFLFVPDKNGDDKGEIEDIEILLTGWGIRDRHETINSLHWGPDGWLYGLEGFATPSKIRKPHGKGKLYQHKEPFPEDILEGEGVDINGGVWRYHPVKDRFEVVAHGFSNPWGIDYDAKGQLFISACVIPHLFHVIPGGIYHRQGGQHFNPYVYSDIQTIVDHRHRSAHGGARVYLSDAFPEEQHGRIFMANIHEHAVLSDILEPKGSGFVAHHGEDFLMANNAQWIGFSMEVGPEGGLYVLDWHDADICGKEVLQKETGRVFRIIPENSQAENWEGRYSDLTQMSDEQLADLQESPSSWHARRARVILQYRASKGEVSTQAISSLKEILNNNANQDWRLRALWTLHVSNGLDEAELLGLLDDKDEYIRSWAIQFLCEDNAPSGQAIAKFAVLSKKDNSAAVRLYLAAALQRVELDSRWEIAEGLSQRGADAEDHNIPKMLWFGIEPLVEQDVERALAIAAKSNIPMLTEFIARRAIEANATEQLAEWLAKRSKGQGSLLKGMRAGLQGRSDIAPPANWDKVYAKLQSNKQYKQIALELGQLFGDAAAVNQSLAALKNKNTDLDQRKTALNNLAKQGRKELVKEIPSLLNEPDLQLDAIRAVASFEEASLAELLLKQYHDYEANAQQEVIQALASRPIYGTYLTYAIKEEMIPRRDIPAYIARQLRRVVGNGFVEVWGPIDQLSSDKKALYSKYEALLTNEAISKADLTNGRAIFQRTCFACHKMYGEGGILGPDITGSNRSNLDYILSNMLDPSGVIQDDYKMVVITTIDGRTYLGNVANENDQQVTLRVVGQDAVVINKASIQSREETPNSMMPEGLLQTLTNVEVIDLVAYLRTTEQVLLPEE